MIALAIETSGRIGSVALARDGAVFAEHTFEHGLQHAARIVPAIDSLCRAASLSPPDIGQIHISAGPGSFTGLRIGITLAKTLSFATGARIVAVPTVRVLAANAPDDARHLIIVLDAKRDQIFTASFDRDGPDWRQHSGAHLGRLAEMLGDTPRPVHLLGEGIPYHQKFIPRDDSGIIVTEEGRWRGRAQAVARIGHEMAQAGSFVSAVELLPIYIRRPEAEEKFEADTLTRNSGSG